MASTQGETDRIVTSQLDAHHTSRWKDRRTSERYGVPPEARRTFLAISPEILNAVSMMKVTASFGRMASLIVQYFRNIEGSDGSCKQLKHVS